jgi:hypothetical protein
LDVVEWRVDFFADALVTDAVLAVAEQLVAALACGIIAAIADWSAPETFRVHLNDLGTRDAVPVSAEEYERIRASA